MPLTAPYVSILVPTYNRRALLLEALDSIAHQTYDDYQVIVIDDGSTDGTAEWAEAQGYTVYVQEKKGFPRAKSYFLRGA